jgi:two-component system, OmpR family, phosphate regulon sensor histidine kinase PhoR
VIWLISLKLKREWVISSEMFKNMPRYFLFSIAQDMWRGAAFISFFILMYVVGFRGTGLLYLVLLFFLYNIVMLFISFGEKNKRADTLNEIFNKIKNNDYKTSQEIVLPVYLSGIQFEIRSMYEKIQDDMDYMKKLEKVRSEFLGNVSHELRTPIFTIQGYIETLLNGAIEDQEVNKQFLEKASRHTNNLNNLLNDLIDISMIESGQMRLSFGYFNAEEYFTSVINEFIPQAEKKSLHLKLHQVPSHLQLFGDKEKIKQVMTNLIQNAIRYTETGDVEIMVEEEEKSGKITVKDTGIGIAPEYLDRIFERFFRVNKARSKEAGDSGLGLAIVKHILDAHGTKIEVHSKMNEGTSFSFRLKK